MVKNASLRRNGSRVGSTAITAPSELPDTSSPSSPSPPLPKRLYHGRVDSVKSASALVPCLDLLKANLSKPHLSQDYRSFLETQRTRVEVALGVGEDEDEDVSAGIGGTIKEPNAAIWHAEDYRSFSETHKRGPEVVVGESEDEDMDVGIERTVKEPEEYTQPFCDFLTENPTVWHAVDYFKEKLVTGGYKMVSLEVISVLTTPR